MLVNGAPAQQGPIIIMCIECMVYNITYSLILKTMEHKLDFELKMDNP